MERSTEENMSEVLKERGKEIPKRKRIAGSKRRSGGGNQCRGGVDSSSWLRWHKGNEGNQRGKPILGEKKKRKRGKRGGKKTVKTSGWIVKKVTATSVGSGDRYYSKVGGERRGGGRKRGI